MKNLYLLLILFTCQTSWALDLVNFYLKPSANPDEVIVHTEVFNEYFSGLEGFTYSITGNIVEFKLCYWTTIAYASIYEVQEFPIALPGGISQYEFIMSLHEKDQTGVCNYNEALDETSITFDYPYNPTATVSISDPNFEGYLEAQGFGDDIENNGLVFDHRFINITRLWMSKDDLNELGLTEITSLDGVQWLTRLTHLFADENFIEVFDATLHPKLKTLRMSMNPIQEIDLTNCPNLVGLWMGGTEVGNFSLNNNSMLLALILSSPNITNIDLSQQSQMWRLHLGDMQITDLDLSLNSSLTDLTLTNLGSISNFELDSNAAVEYLTIQNCNQLESVQIFAPNVLQCEVTDNENLTILNINSCTNLTNLQAYNNAFVELDLSGNPNLEDVFLMNNQLETLNIKNGTITNPEILVAFENPDLFCVEVDEPLVAPYGTWYFDTSANILYTTSCTEPIITFPDPNFEHALVNNLVVDTDLDGTPDSVCDTNEDGFIQLTEALDVVSLMVPNSTIVSVEGIQYFSNLEAFDASSNEIAQMDVSYNELLSDIRMSDNLLESLYFGNNEENYQRIWVDNNQLSSFPAFQFENLTSLKVNGNFLSQLSVENGNNSQLELFHAQNNPDLFCIGVDDADYANNQPNWLKDEGTIYSENCSLGNDDRSWQESVVLYPNPATDQLFIESTIPIDRLRIFDVSGKEVYLSNTVGNQISITSLSKGLYFMEVISENGRLVKRIIKN